MEVSNDILHGDLFIVPNSLQVCDHVSIDPLYGYNIDNISGLQVCLEGWITNDECDNWSCHDHPKLKNRLTSRFPVVLFMGKKRR